MAQHDDIFDANDDGVLLAQLLAPLDGDSYSTQLRESRTFLPHIVLSPHEVAPPSMDEVACTTTFGALDEALLFAETDALLGLLDPLVATADDLATATATTECSTASISPASSTVDCMDTSASANAVSQLLDSSSSSSSSGDVSSLPATQTALSNNNITNDTLRSRRRGSKPGSMRNPSRERLLDELTYLRHQVVVLETELASKQQTLAITAATTDTETSALTRAVGPAWERIAKRQRTSCDRSISENKRLRHMLALQRDLVANMEQTLSTWQHITQQPSSWTTPRSPLKIVHFVPSDAIRFEMLVSELDATYDRMDDMFAAAGLDALKHAPLLRMRHCTTDDTSKRSFVEVVEVDISPFAFELVAHVGRLCSAHMSQQPDCLVFERSDWRAAGIVTEKYVVQRTWSSGSDGKPTDVTLDVLIAMKEIVSVDRVVMIWCSMFCCDALFPDAYVQDIGAFVLTPLGSASSASSSDATAGTGTLMTSCSHVEPKRFGASSQVVVSAEKDAMTALVMASYHDDMQELNDMMERMLLEETRKRVVCVG